jgi:hypothetical protein
MQPLQQVMQLLRKADVLLTAADVICSAASASAAAASADAFDDVYLGSKSSDPTTDNDGDPLAAGMLYYNTVSTIMRIYSGSAWENVAVSTAGFTTLTGVETLTNKTLTAPKIANGGFVADANGNEQIKFTTTASAVNELTVVNSAAGNAPEISSTGGDTDIDLKITPKGSGKIVLDGISFPNADGTANQALVTDGSGTLSFASVTGRTGTVDWCTTTKTAPFTAVNGDGFFVNTTGGAITVTLPSTPSQGDIIALKDYGATWDTNNVTLCNNGSKINGVCATATLNTEGQSITLIYVDSTKGWQDIHDSTAQVTGVLPAFVTATGGTPATCGDFKIHTFTGPGTFCVSCAGNPLGSTTVDYLVVAGGGGNGVGSGGGGGGAGGVRASSGTASGCYSSGPLGACVSALPVSIQAYPITVGGGGPGSPASPSKGTPGVNSIFSTITSAGGGAGGSEASTPALNGGSGGGGGYNGTGGTGNTPPVSPPQGNTGGTGTTPTPIGYYGGGGGGATAAGANPPGSVGGAGGDGLQNSISGSAVYYGGGGGGGGQPCVGGAGGLGGGGAGGQYQTVAGTAGTDNTGGGAGGGMSSPGLSPNYGTANGGSGIVIIRYKFQ